MSEHTAQPQPKIKRIGILTSGGDCPGLNAVIRAVAKSAMNRFGLECVGIAEGYMGLIQNRMEPLTDASVSNILTRGGTILGTNNKCDPRRYPAKTGDHADYIDATDRCLDNISQRQLDALIIIGGDGSMNVAAHLVKHGVNCIGVPKTIDNDLPGTDVTFGFATAVATATDALDRIHTTAASHHRVMAVEVMGRNAGWIALHAGIAGGADIILIPEMPYSVERICHYIQDRARRGKLSSIVCISEGARPRDGKQVVARVDPSSPDPIRLGGIGQILAAQIEEATRIETRTTVLGHVQRGGSPLAGDRVLATAFGHAAAEVLMAGHRGRLVVMKSGTINHLDITEIAGKQRLVPADHPLIRAARDVGTSFGN